MENSLCGGLSFMTRGRRSRGHVIQAATTLLPFLPALVCFGLKIDTKAARPSLGWQTILDLRANVLILY